MEENCTTVVAANTNKAAANPSSGMMCQNPSVLKPRYATSRSTPKRFGKPANHQQILTFFPPPGKRLYSPLPEPWTRDQFRSNCPVSPVSLIGQFLKRKRGFCTCRCLRGRRGRGRRGLCVQKSQQRSPLDKTPPPQLNFIRLHSTSAQYQCGLIITTTALLRTPGQCVTSPLPPHKSLEVDPVSLPAYLIERCRVTLRGDEESRGSCYIKAPERSAAVGLSTSFQLALLCCWL